MQPVTGDQLTHRSANQGDGARLDIVPESFWGGDHQCGFFNVRVFNPFAHSYRNTTLTIGRIKRRAYDERVREIEHGSFSPLVFTTSSGMGTTAAVVYKRIASAIVEKHDKPFSKVIHWIHCRLNFSLPRSAIMCLRGSHSALHCPDSPPSTKIWPALLCEGMEIP